MKRVRPILKGPCVPISISRYHPGHCLPNLAGEVALLEGHVLSIKVTGFNIMAVAELQQEFYFFDLNKKLNIQYLAMLLNILILLQVVGRVHFLIAYIFSLN